MSYINILVESIIVGIYSSIIYLPFLIWKINPWIIFSVGFIKHFFGYYSGLQSYYCRLYKNTLSKATNKNLFLFSVAEGFSYIILYYILFFIFTYNTFIGLFCSGVILHIIAEFTGIHEYFLIHNCCCHNVA